jgi:hypothetical protein
VVRAQEKCPAPPALSAPAGPNIFNVQQELDLGDVEAEWLEKNFRVIHDDELADHLNVIANRILAQLPPTQLKFRVVLIDSPIVNSFSVGAGRIYVTRKMVAFLRNDDELAGMLGHEMGHILTHQNSIEMTRTFHDILGVNSVGDRKDIFDKSNRMLDTIARDRGALVKTAERQQRDEEPHQYEADRVALYAAAAAGFSPRAFVEFYDRLALTQGKTGILLTDIFQVTKPGEKRLREIHKSESSLPPSCREIAPAAPSAEFLAWQSEVIPYSGFGHREQLVGAVSKKSLNPPLRTDIENLKFSPNGEYSLAQDDASVFVFVNDPFTFLFRIDAADAHEAQFSPDSQKILLLTHGLRIEEWSIDDQERTSVHEMALPEGCTQSSLSHDGKLLACVSHQLDFSLIDVETGNVLFTKKVYFEPDLSGPVGEYLRQLTLSDWLQECASSSRAGSKAPASDFERALKVQARRAGDLHAIAADCGLHRSTARTELLRAQRILTQPSRPIGSERAVYRAGRGVLINPDRRRKKSAHVIHITRAGRSNNRSSEPDVQFGKSSNIGRKRAHLLSPIHHH